jgi:CheY-like chemotaxis protein
LIAFRPEKSRLSSHILLIEDDNDLRSEILEYMARRKHRVTVCAAIAEAEELPGSIVDASLAPNMVVSDIRLPDGDGLTFYFRQARRFPVMRWILMSGTTTSYELVTTSGSSPTCLDTPSSIPYCFGGWIASSRTPDEPLEFRALRLLPLERVHHRAVQPSLDVLGRTPLFEPR